MKTTLLLPLTALTALAVQAAEPIKIAAQRELFVDHHLIERLDGVRLELHRPQAREIVFRFDQPWEGIYCGYETVLKDGETYRFYYRGMPEAKHDLDTEVTCVAESKDGIHWSRPKLTNYLVRGAKENNVVLARSRGCHNLAPFIDTNPACPPAQRYKAMGGSGSPGLLAFTSPDGLRWKQLQENPVITKGAFDSQNNAFWSLSEGHYVCYFRVFREGKRWIARATSKDFIHWSEPIDLELNGNPREHLYTNQFGPYLRAPQIYLGMPTRYFPGRRVVTTEEALRIGTPQEWDYVNACTDIQLTSARGGADLKRTFMEAFIRPGADLRNWTSRASYAARGIVQTGERELSLYVKHHSGYKSNHLRRYTIRPDGFISVNAPYTGGELVTKLFTFTGSTLSLNFASSAAGGMWVEIQGPDGKAIEGFSLQDCTEIIGDRLEHTVRWKGGTDVSALRGKPVRLRVRMKDADLYSFRFVEAG
ncbi:MAG: hypothetical protein ABGZ37_11010 [Akkermansiaceae bacterium]